MHASAADPASAAPGGPADAGTATGGPGSSAPGPPRPDPLGGGRVSRRRGLVLVLVALAAVAVAVVLLTQGGATSHKLVGPAAEPFSLRYPSSWRALTAAQLSGVPDVPLAAVRRADGTGLIIVRRKPLIATRSAAELAARLQRELRRRFTDFRPGTARIVRVRSGPAFYYSFVRLQAGRVQGIVLVPASGRTYVLDIVARTGATAAVREAGQIVRSFSA